ncbi:hypothetical protein [Streptomyces sp. NPDC088719]|uniref:hypothetical protein n=1 Tax=Streptomyces sp. NPDC088719 TaxID=3365872 RepID=UPI00380EEF0D
MGADRPAARRRTSGRRYDPDTDDVVQAELVVDAAAAAAREAELREAMRIAARADELQALRDQSWGWTTLGDLRPRLLDAPIFHAMLLGLPPVARGGKTGL